MSSIIINPNAPQSPVDDSPIRIEQTEDGSARLVHKDTGAFIAFFKDGTILIRDAKGSGVQTLPTGDMIVGAIGNVINLGTNIAFRGQTPEQVAWVFDQPQGETTDDVAQLDESGQPVPAGSSAGDDEHQLGAEHDGGGASASS